MTIREEHIGPAARSRAASILGIRRQSFAMCVLLLVQYEQGTGPLRSAALYH